ncbi:uncharacterized protein N7498_007819 [Penicillium cinerascens]|uniref:Uncharacterized protein n=1 Tax=Penicillium cinerascens TaxID=70096 RepID=A0A9W9JMK8_9EURO|nr:uncharacterized protein N7498_007819 [Penicillium cinerascens]KAJ5198702.1 hypothetical protein N7498_007819 [Penicillium cinerascens]
MWPRMAMQHPRQTLKYPTKPDGEAVEWRADTELARDPSSLGTAPQALADSVSCPTDSRPAACCIARGRTLGTLGCIAGRK